MISKDLGTKLLHWFLENDAILVKMKKKQEKLFNFLLGRKNEKYEIIFLTRKRNERKKAKISILIVLTVSLGDS